MDKRGGGGAEAHVRCYTLVWRPVVTDSTHQNATVLAGDLNGIVALVHSFKQSQSKATCHVGDKVEDMA